MKRLNEAREQRTTVAAEVRNLLEKNPGALWKQNPQNQIDYAAKMGQIEDLDSEIKRLQAAADLNADAAFDAAALDVAGARAKKNGVDPVSAKGVYLTYLRQGLEGLSAEQRQVFKNTMSTTTNSQGGYTVATEVAAQIIDYIKAFGGMRQVAEAFQTAQGNPLNYPTSDGRSETGEVIAQNTTANALDPSFGVVTLNAWKFSSKVVTVPLELLQDASVDIEAFVDRRCATRLGRIQNTKFTIGAGSGSGEPQGVTGVASAGKTGLTGQTLTMIYADVVDTAHAVDPGYRALGNCRWMMADSSLKVLRKIVDGNSRPIFIPSYDAGITKGVPSELYGYPIQINQDVAAMAANAKSVLFGDFSFYKIRDVMEATMFRFTDSAYIKLGQIGFLMWARADGNLVDTNAVVYYANSAT
jgi:HK97 family phage major capsid protein